MIGWVTKEGKKIHTTMPRAFDLAPWDFGKETSRQKLDRRICMMEWIIRTHEGEEDLFREDLHEDFCWLMLLKTMREIANES